MSSGTPNFPGGNSTPPSSSEATSVEENSGNETADYLRGATTIPGSPNSPEGSPSRLNSVSPTCNRRNDAEHKRNALVGELLLAESQSGELFQQMKNAFDSTGVHEAMSLMFHVGRFSADSYLNKLWSCVRMADFLLQCIDPPLVKYPMASVFDATSEFDSSFKKLHRNPKWFKNLKEAYEIFRMTLMVQKKEISTWPIFTGHFRIATDVLVTFAAACRKYVDDPSIVTPAYLNDQMVFLEKLVAGHKRDQLRDSANMAKLVTPNRLAMVIRGDDLPMIEWKPNSKPKGKPKAKRKKDKSNCDVETKEKTRKVRKPRVRTNPSNPEHFQEDNNINPPIGNLSSDSDTIFSGGVTEFEGQIDNNPMICIETFRNENHEVVTAPVKYRSDDGELKSYAAGAEEYMTMKSKKLSEVVLCPTPKAYVYFFRDAHKKSHFLCNGQAEAREYLSKVMKHDVDIKKIPNWKLKDPLKLITDLSMVNGGLREGDFEESDFVIVPEGTDLFAQHFGPLDQLPFPAAKWMEFFDKQEEDQKDDEQGRGFCNGHHDFGWTREGVSTSTHASQDNGIESVVAKPSYMGIPELVSTLGPIMDRTTQLMDAKCFEGGEKLMSNVERNSEFGQPFREKLSALLSRFDAGTVVRQKIRPPVSELEPELEADPEQDPEMSELVDRIPVPQNLTTRHVDNQNCTRKGYTVVAVFSFLCMWKAAAYRMSLIMYTRASVGNYCWRNYLGRKLREKLRDHVVERNGGVLYQDFSLTDDMGYLQQAKFKDDARPAFFLKPSAANLSESFFKRNPESQWKNTESQETTKVTWLKFNLDGKLEDPLDIMVFPEFDSRFGFVSSFASQINRFVDNGANQMPAELKFQLIYIALMSTSQIQFFCVLEQLIKDRGAILEDYQKSLAEKLTDVTLFRRYQRVCKDLKFSSMVGGPYNRWQAPPTTHDLFYEDEKLRENLEKIPALIGNVNDGTYLNADGVLTSPPGTELTMIGTVASLSFAPLVVFTNCASSEEAINTAKQSLVNTSSSNTYYNALIEFLEEEDDSELQMKKDDKFVYRLFKAIAKGWQTVIGTIENVCCAAFRKKDKYDVFFRGQDLFILDDTSNRVKVKKYNSEEWIEL